MSVPVRKGWTGILETPELLVGGPKKLLTSTELGGIIVPESTEGQSVLNSSLLCRQGL